MSENPEGGADAAPAPAPDAADTGPAAAPPVARRPGLWQRLGQALALLLGTWAAPPWLRWTGQRLGSSGGRLAATVRARPQASAGAFLALVLLGVGGYFGHAWWQARPKPVEVQFTVTHPPLTDFANAGLPQPLVLKFSQSVAPLALVGKEVTAGISLAPLVAGNWRWASDTQLEFQPQAEWPVGAQFKGVLERSAIAPQITLDRYQFEFASAAFVPTLRKAEFHQDPVNPSLKKAVFELNFTHPVNAAELERRIELRLAGQADGVLGVGRETTRFTVAYDKLRLNAYVHSAVLPIPKEAASLAFTLDKGVPAQAVGAPSTEAVQGAVTVPGLYSLDVAEVGVMVVTNDRYEPEQVLTLSSSQLVHEREMARAVSAWVLPLQNPRVKKEEQGEEPYAWADPAEVTEQVLKLATRLELAPVPAEQEHTQSHAFKLRADVGRALYVRIDPALKSFGGYRMRSAAQLITTVPPYPAELRILSQGALLAMSGEKKVAVLVRDLPGLRVELARVQPSQLQHLVSQSQGNFANPEFLGSFGPDNLADRYETRIPLPALERGKPHYEAIDLAAYLAKGGDNKRGLFLLKVQGYDPQAEAKAARLAQAAPDPNAPAPTEAETETEENESGDETVDPASKQEQRLVLVTDLGLLVKQHSDGSRDVFVQSIFGGEPVAGVSVDVVAKNGSTLFSQTTDAAGRVHFGKLEGLQRERAPLLLLARKGGDMSFMPLNRNDRQLDYSRFDVGGLQNARSADQLSAYLFSDRGIYRPGETLQVGLIVKSADWARPLAGVPLEAEVLDARGLAVKRERVRVGAGGFFELSHTTQATSPTGNYTVNLNILKDGQVLRQIGSTTVKVQEFLPDRMKVGAQLLTTGGVPVAPLGEGWVHPKDLKGRINAQNLFGTPAENRRVELALTLSPAYPSFRSHAAYQFYDPQRAKEGINEDLPEGKTNAQGDADFELQLSRYARATYRLSLLGKVFEPEGGRSVAAETGVLVSELPFLVGVKHDGDLNFVARGSKRVSHLLAIDPQARPRASEGLTLQRVERKVVSVLMRQPNDTYKYESRQKEALLAEQPLALPVAGHALALDTRTPGNFSYVLRDAAGMELNRIDYSVAGQGNVSRSLERNAELQLTLNKKDYLPGEEIEVSIRAPYVGAGLITIERDKVFAQAWFKTSTTASVQKIRLPKDFEGNGYVNVQFIRDPGSDEIFMSPLSYGVVPFATSLAQRTQALKLTAPALSKPGQTLKFKLSSDRPTRAVVFAVDEGILQVARYRNADPLGHFFQKRALEVRSAQILDLILPEFKRLMAASAPGGDEAGANARFLNPFKRRGEAPAVYWSGIVDVQGEREFSYTVPDHFNGTLRVMAVAVNDTAMGVAQAQAVVRGDFVISPNLPLMVTPGDVFEVSVGVANNIVGSAPDAPVQLTLKPAASFELLGPATQTLKIGALREAVGRYRLKVKDASSATLGSAALQFSASLGGKTATRQLEISVRPASPRATTLALGHFSGSTEVPTPRDLVPEFRRQEVALSVLPLALAPGLARYLDEFEHACTEQLVSRAMSQLVMARRPEFAAASAAERTPQQGTQAWDGTLRSLRTRQNAQGGFGLWGAAVQADEWVSVYAVHLMLEAQELQLPGAAVPADMVQQGLAYLQQLASSNPADLNAARSRAYATYLLTRHGAITTPLLASLRETLDAKHAAVWKQDATAAFLAASYQLLKQERTAAELITPLMAQLETGTADFRYADYNDPTIRDAQMFYLVARHFPARLKTLAPGALQRFVKPLGQGRYNTLSAAWSILAIDGLARQWGGEALGKLSATQVDAKGAAVALKLPNNLLPRATFDAGTVKLKLGNEAALPTWYAVMQSGFDRQPPATELKAGLEVLREYVGADGKPITNVKVGDELTVKLSLRALALDGQGPGAAMVGAVALSDLLPGGFEPVQQRDANGADSSVSGPALAHAELREDRVVIYASASNAVQTYTYRMRATNAGEFVVPPAWAEGLYERERQARSLAGKVVVGAK
jgi:alpha-2-macroglobulin